MSPSPDIAPTALNAVLFVPAHRPAMLEKAQSRDADALVIDLEDAVAPGDKQRARECLHHRLGDGTLDGPHPVYVRINAMSNGGVEDLDALRGFAVDGLMVPKVEDARRLDDLRNGMPPIRSRRTRVGLIPQVESAAGVLNLPQILGADAPIDAVALGGEDLAADLGVPRSAQSVELLFPRAWTALCARAKGVAALDTVYTNPTDIDGLVREAQLAAQLGFSGKLVIHPAQVRPVRTAFAPSRDQVAWARRVMEAAHGRKNDTGARRVGEQMIDAPVIAQARRVLERAQLADEAARTAHGDARGEREGHMGESSTSTPPLPDTHRGSARGPAT